MSVSLPDQANAYGSVDDDGPSEGRQPQDSWTWEEKTTTNVLTYQTKIDNQCKTLSIYLFGGTGFGSLKNFKNELWRNKKIKEKQE
jgi:hypothetical protein